MFQRMRIEVVTPSGVVVDHQLIVHDDPVGLLVILPGRGYTCDFPLLHYLRKAAAELGYDVLSVWYSFQIAPEDAESVTADQLAQEVDEAMRMALKRGYARLCIAGKSLGTPLAALHAQQAERLILLTPIGTAVQDARTTPTLAIIGTTDQVYQPEQTVDGEHTRWMVLEGLDHSLEMPGDWAASLKALRQVTQACAEFLS